MERKKIKLQTLTPVHIGNGEILKENFDYIKTKDKNGIYITPINHNKLFKCLNEKGQNVILQYTSMLQSGGGIKSFIDKLPDNEKESCYNRYIWLDTEQKNLAQELREQIYDGFGKPYIPGSSIKGAIRTVIISDLMQNQRELNLRYNAVLGNITQYLQVSDVMFENGCTDALNMINLNIRENPYRDESKRQLVEAITKGEESYLTIKITNTQEFQVASSIKDLFCLINKHTQRILNNEIKFWNKDEYIEKGGLIVKNYIDTCKELRNDITALDNNSCILRLGHANGWKFITGDWVKTKATNNEEWHNIVNRSRPNNERNYSQYPFPKTRRINITDDKVNLLGFVKLTIEE